MISVITNQLFINLCTIYTSEWSGRPVACYICYTWYISLHIVRLGSLQLLLPASSPPTRVAVSYTYTYLYLIRGTARPRDMDPLTGGDQWHLRELLTHRTSNRHLVSSRTATCLSLTVAARSDPFAKHSRLFSISLRSAFGRQNRKETIMMMISGL